MPRFLQIHGHASWNATQVVCGGREKLRHYFSLFIFALEWIHSLKKWMVYQQSLDNVNIWKFHLQVYNVHVRVRGALEMFPESYYYS